MSCDTTLQAYDQRARDYAQMVADWDDPDLDAFIAWLPPNGRVLDLGCGPGHIAARMVAAGLNVDAVDGSPEMVRLAAAQPGVHARLARFDEIDGHAVYDGIWASFSLLHAPRDAFPRHLQALHKAARPGARLLLGMKLGTGEATDSLGRFYAYYSQAELNEHLTKAGFAIASRRINEGKGLAGVTERFTTITAYA